MIRDYKLDVQIDVVAFACFIHAFSTIEGFESMPWQERSNQMQEHYNILVSEKTLRNWSAKLINTNTINKSKINTFCWCSYKIDGETIRELVTGNKELEETKLEYYHLRKGLLKTFSWKETQEVLWQRFGCCFYYCKSFVLSAFDDVGNAQEVYELIEEIAEKLGCSVEKISSAHRKNRKNLNDNVNENVNVNGNGKYFPVNTGKTSASPSDGVVFDF